MISYRKDGKHGHPYRGKRTPPKTLWCLGYFWTKDHPAEWDVWSKWVYVERKH